MGLEMVDGCTVTGVAVRAGRGEDSQRGVGGVHASPLLLLSKPLNLSPWGLAQGRILPDPHPCLAVTPPALPTAENAHLPGGSASDQQIYHWTVTSQIKPPGRIPPLELRLRSLRSAVCLIRRTEKIKENFKQASCPPKKLLPFLSWAFSMFP